jgi:hypothetical protein
VERLVRFVITLANEREAGAHGAEDDLFLEELLWKLLPLSGAADKSVRFRICQLVASLLHGLDNDTELTDELYDELGAAMTERLRDRAPAVRMQAARALARLQVRRQRRACVRAFKTPAPRAWPPASPGAGGLLTPEHAGLRALISRVPLAPRAAGPR